MDLLLHGDVLQKKKRKHEHEHEHSHHDGEGDSEHRKKKKRKRVRSCWFDAIQCSYGVGKGPATLLLTLLDIALLFTRNKQEREEHGENGESGENLAA
jgi:hypothetical protein